ncbi:MAG TPA: hypothetical protein VFH90_02185 [Candidatus Limnocylindria bacterium]|nr:hypothetical protein [Candidatus Limnocylindria bacterium]
MTMPAAGPGPKTPMPAALAAVNETNMAEALGSTDVLQTLVDLPSTRGPVNLPVYVRRELRWRDALPATFGAVPNKQAIAFDGAPTYPELVVVQLLERAGWGAAWRKNWGGLAYWRGIREPIDLPPMTLSILSQVSQQAGHDSPWDVVAWRGRELRLLVSRQEGGQRVSAYVANWLDAALRMGIPLGCFGIVEHHIERIPRRR